jgi:hypothetical protein
MVQELQANSVYSEYVLCILFQYFTVKMDYCKMVRNYLIRNLYEYQAFLMCANGFKQLIIRGDVW